MAARPRDIPDLYLAPVALDLDERLAQFEGRTDDEISHDLVLATNREPRGTGERAELALEAVTHLVDTHGWEVGWCPRGLRMSHDENELVLGVPESLRRYLADPAADAGR
ncbi:hypothetical protein [Nocardioides sp. YIM 152588]|uniref:hypothetical protein n=1 Tax=Nocardioides sp. YIM 152588 TaxID=3158259 RepID=UPI0032E463FB